MTGWRTSRTAAAAGVIIIIGAAVLFGQGAPSTAAADTAAVVSELRGLRADLVRTASAGVQAQLLVARLSIQEQRIAALTQQLSTIQTTIAASTRRDENGEVVLRGLSPQRVQQYNQARAQETALRGQLSVR